MMGIEFHHHWLKGRTLGDRHRLDDYAISIAAARAEKFLRPRPDQPKSPLSKLAYAFQFASSAYARILSGLAEAGRGPRVKGPPADATRNAAGRLAARVPPP